jgi:hypothetical protein
MRDKYHAELDFGYGRKPIRFTAVDLDRLMSRFTAEVRAEDLRRTAARDYTWIEPNLRVEVCSSWAQFDQFEHV